MRTRLIYLFVAALLLVLPATAQNETVTVPDLTGLNAPQAAAALNAVGLGIGAENVLIWTEDNPLSVGLVAEQSPAPGEAVTAGTPVDVSILRTNNMSLIYDDNDITLVNTTENVADVSGLRFVAVEGENPAAFAATQWSSSLRSTQCMQLWSISRGNAKSLPECLSIQNWLSTRTTSLHFWTAANGVQQFAVLENGIERTRCDAATAANQDAPLRCDFFYSGASAAADITPYIYLAYTTDAIAVINQSEDRWMPTDRTLIYNPQSAAPDAGSPMGNAEVYTSPSPVADVTQLAPGQCIMMTTNQPDGTSAPQDCTIIAQQDLPAEWVFWLNDFEVESANDNLRRNCPAATADRVTLCIVPQ